MNSQTYTRPDSRAQASICPQHLLSDLDYFEVNPEAQVRVRDFFPWEQCSSESRQRCMVAVSRRQAERGEISGYVHRGDWS